MVGPGPPSTILLYGQVLCQSLALSSNYDLLKSIGLFFAQLMKEHVVADCLLVLDEMD